MIYKTLILGSALAAATASSTFAQSCVPGDNFVSQNSYEVLRKGKPIGTHVISFYGAPGAMRINAETNMKVKALFITAFKYRYVSDETYCGRTLQSALTTVDDNGDEKIANVTLQGESYLSESYLGTTELLPPFYTSNHWNRDVVNATSILNTATGRLENVTVTAPAGADDDGVYVYEVRGDIDYNTRYAVDGQWLGMDFIHPKGGEMEFRCIDCRNTPPAFLQQVIDPTQPINLTRATAN